MLLVLAVLAPLPARANPADLFGLGSEAMARGGAMTAVATGYEATFYNPAGLAFGERLSVTTGYYRIFSALEVHAPGGDSSPDIEEPDLLQLGFAFPFGERFGIGLGVALPPAHIAHVLTPKPDEPSFPYFQNRSQRLTLFPCIAFRPWPWIGIGVGMNFLAGLEGFVRSADGPTRAVEPTVFEELPAIAAAHVGLRVEPTEWLSLGFAYRQRFGVRVFTVTSNIVGGIPVDLTLETRALQSPHELAFGAAFRQERVTLSLDGVWSRWSEERSPFIRVDAVVSGVRISPPPFGRAYRDTGAVRAGLAIDQRMGADLALTYRAGGSFESRLVGAQRGRTNLIDGAHFGIGLGAGLRIRLDEAHDLRIDAHFQTLVTASVRHEKVVSTIEEARRDGGVLADEDVDMPGVQITNPGFPAISGGGNVYTIGLSVTLELEP